MVLPKSIRSAHRWRPGTEFIVEERTDGILLRPKTRTRTGTVDDLIGIVKYKGKRKSLKDMERGIEAEAWKHR